MLQVQQFCLTMKLSINEPLFCHDVMRVSWLFSERVQLGQLAKALKWLSVRKIPFRVLSPCSKHWKIRERNMKSIFMTIGAAIFMMAVVSDANAVTCAKGVYRAGCAGPNGAAVVRRPVAVAPRRVVVAPVNRGRCAWVNGRKVCR